VEERRRRKEHEVGGRKVEERRKRKEAEGLKKEEGKGGK
jgi:hypothetical protein